MSDAREAARNAKASVDGLRTAAAKAETSPQPNDRSEFDANRAAGLRARHETREARAVRRAVAEEIAKALEARDGTEWALAGQHAGVDAATIARQIGAEETPS